MVRPRKPVDPGLSKDVRRSKASYEVARIDYLRAVKSALQVMSQGRVAQELGVTQPAISQLQTSLKKVEILEGDKVCANPEEACLRYAAGQFTMPGLIRILKDFHHEGADIEATVKLAAKRVWLDKNRCDRVRREVLGK